MTCCTCSIRRRGGKSTVVARLNCPRVPSSSPEYNRIQRFAGLIRSTPELVRAGREGGDRRRTTQVIAAGPQCCSRTGGKGSLPEEGEKPKLLPPNRKRNGCVSAALPERLSVSGEDFSRTLSSFSLFAGTKEMTR
ncbi:unnamed protein product [Cuscuta europaea]|uniref:Uncharacterized protein n=1 Tax=Cuscuta europaea TaxID=41803 RepID=A0A9P1ELC3_CUSEU|nr:unnamed protein product [Cuscuta europaea]